MKRFFLTLAGLGALGALSGPARADLRLAMFEQEGCGYCDQWRQEIGPIWPKTDEGRTAPLQRIDITTPLPAGMVLISRPVYTPTFVLLRDGSEIGRLEGYPGEAFFWTLLGQMLHTQPEWRETAQ
ncbi:hypothetical protein C8N32_11739 [Rhodovulum imhoffii]|uniref:Thioredoxin-like protein n=1 Tax=Rhodovulum imhoffii TaxID=365340 RepID=A0A2T5BPY2_9RHOB|nr:hypothetical protein [Rhodovulum imhoffii]MBK5934175.1 hypothetical protein [Rhodovulum imhoffii]PTN01091.1 hypothetical protein C8N32_11739 [Rhodovulum imhoffii]